MHCCLSVVLVSSLFNPLAEGGQVTKLADGVYFMEMHTKPEFLGCNTGWVVFNDYVLVLDAGFPLSAKLVVEQVRKTTDKPIRYVFDTHYHGDHSFGNGVYVDLGATGVAHTLCLDEQRRKGTQGFQAQAESKDELSRRQVAGAAWREATIAFESKMIFDDGKQRVELLHLGHGHTRGDAVAYLPKQRVLFTGDACVNGAYNYMGDGDSESWIRVLESMQQLNVEVVAPGHGPLARRELFETQKRWFVELRKQVGAGVAAGKTVEQIQAAIDIPSYEQWTGQKATAQTANITHVYNELTGRVTPAALLRDIGLHEGPSPTRDSPGWTPPKKVVVPNLAPSRLADLRGVAPAVEIAVARTPEEAVKAVADADGIIGFSSAAVVQAGKQLRWVQTAAAGVENETAITELVQRPITLTNAQRIYAPEIGDHALGLLLSLTRGVRAAVAQQVQEGVWGMPRGFDPSQFIELRGKTILVVGLGGLGTEVSRRAHAFGVRVLALDAKASERPSFVWHLGAPGELKSLAGQVDAVISCVPLTRATIGLFSADFFAAMKPTAYFINVGRGKCVDTAALVHALKNKQIAGAGLDVTEPEPLPAGHELWKMPNVVITPHIASQSDGRNERLWLLYRENLRRFAAGEPLLSVVDKSAGY